MTALAVSLLAGMAMPPAARPVSAGRAVQRAPRADPSLGAQSDAELHAVYARRGFEPVWFEGERPTACAFAAVEHMRAAGAENIDLGHHELAGLRRALRDPRSTREDRLALDMRLSLAVADWAQRLHTPEPQHALRVAEPAAAGPDFSVATNLETLTSGPLRQGLGALARVNPIQARLREALLRSTDPGTRLRLSENLDRSRGLPPDFGERSLLVDIAAQSLEVWERGEIADSMPVVVGKATQPTPAMSGVMRYAVLRPYWNIPPDLAAARIAPVVLREGAGALKARRLELVHGFAPPVRTRDPATVDWAAVAAGDEVAYLRQSPGPNNMMGRVKFIFPNRWGVYLHDTPSRELFSQDLRAASSGCVRLSDAARLARRLIGQPLDVAGDAERRVELASPLPVYLVYLTARGGADGLSWREDLYGLDAET